MRHLGALPVEPGKELIAEVLPDNISILKVFEKSGLRPQVVHVTLQL